MAAPQVPDDVRTLVLRRLEAPEFIEVLYLLQATPSRLWNAQEVAAALQLDEVAVSRPLVALRQAGILRVTISDDIRYTYAPSADDAETISALSGLYRERPKEVLDLIAQRPRFKLRLFADAFRLRRRD